MAKYVFIYKGGSMPQSEEEKQSVMAAWGTWFGALGEAIVDPGNPFGASSSVGNGGTSGLGGYSIVSAASLDDAVGKAGGCPILAGADGSVEVYEALDM
jgi:hypothetical protein